MAKQSATHAWNPEKEKHYCDECIGGSLKMFGVEEVEEFPAPPDVQVFCEQCGIRGLMRWKDSPLSMDRGQPIMYVSASDMFGHGFVRGTFLEITNESTAKVINDNGRISYAHSVTIHRATS